MTQKTEKFTKDKAKREGDTAWIEQKLKDGNFRNVCDISKSSPTPTKDLGQLTLSPKRTVEDEDLGRGKRTKFQKSFFDDSPVRRALFVDNDLEIEQVVEDEIEQVVEDDGDTNYEDLSEKKPKRVPQTPRPTFENAISLQDRFNTPDTQAALWWNMVSM